MSALCFFAAGKVQHLSEALDKHRLVNYYSRRANRVNNDYFYSLWRSQIPAGIPCGVFFVIHRSFTMAYLGELANNLATYLWFTRTFKMKRSFLINIY